MAASTYAWVFWLISGVIALSASWLFMASFRKDPLQGRPRCRKCQYDMSGLVEAGGNQSLQCPECGFIVRSVADLPKRKRRFVPRLLGTLMLCTATGVALAPKARAEGWLSVVPSAILVLLSPPIGHDDFAITATLPGVPGTVTTPGAIRVQTGSFIAAELFQRTCDGELNPWHFRLALWKTGAIRMRRNWVVGEPIGVSVRTPSWLRGPMACTLFVDESSPCPPGIDLPFERRSDLDGSILDGDTGLLRGASAAHLDFAIRDVGGGMTRIEVPLHIRRVDRAANVMPPVDSRDTGKAVARALTIHAVEKSPGVVELQARLLRRKAPELSNLAIGGLIEVRRAARAGGPDEMLASISWPADELLVLNMPLEELLQGVADGAIRARFTGSPEHSLLDVHRTRCFGGEIDLSISALPTQGRSSSSRSRPRRRWKSASPCRPARS